VPVAKGRSAAEKSVNVVQFREDVDVPQGGPQGAAGPAMRTALALVALSAVAAIAVVTGCSAEPTDSADDSANAFTGSDGTDAGAAPAPTGPTPIAGSSLKLPIPGSKGNKISAADQATIVTAWLNAKKDYYDPGAKYVGANGAAIAGPALSEVAGVPCGASYSTLVCRFYAHMPSYAAVIPNYRGCFSYMANGGLQVPTSLWNPKATTDSTTMRPSTYAEAFEHCLYQDYDKVLNKTPLWSTTEVAANRAKGKAGEIGVVRFMSPELRAVFKYIMYTWYEPATFDNADQAAILKAVYDKYTPPSVPPAVGLGTTHGSAPIYIDAMNAYIAANKQL
jgi:hypothetical protein